MAGEDPVLSAQDQQVLDVLRANGSDLEKPHPIDHYLYFRSQPVAESAGRELAAAGYNVRVRPGAQGNDWLLLVSHVMVPRPNAVAHVVSGLEKFAASRGGEYDGWEAPIVK